MIARIEVRIGSRFPGRERSTWPVIGVALLTFIVGSLGLNERKHVLIWDEAAEARPS